jgi:hypothetical protein
MFFICAFGSPVCEDKNTKANCKEKPINLVRIGVKFVVTW